MTSIDTRHRPRGKTVRKFVALALIQLGFLAACGGGGGYGGGGGTPPPPPPVQMIATPGPPNVETMTVGPGPAGVKAVNTAYISVKVCVPGSTTMCKIIDNIEVDTGSSGLRILSSVLTATPAITLPAETDGTNPFAECLRFADGDAWGPLAVADIQLPVSGETAANVHVQVIGDPAYTTLPSDCMTNPENTVAKFGANGILGVGPFAQDCGSACVGAIPSTGAVYYSCPSPSSCAGASLSTLLQQIQNPVTLFATDFNGVIIELPAVVSAGAASSAGSLVFGIGTRTNNGLGTATVLPEDRFTGFISATYPSSNGTVYADGYLDSGSNGNFFTDSSLTPCTMATGFYCPASTMNKSATLKGTNAATLAAAFSVANAETLFSTAGYTAFSNLGGTTSDAAGFDLGLPFFYGHNVFTAIENANTPGGGMGPYFAY
jgi:uncharacterized protein DUF3443